MTTEQAVTVAVLAIARAWAVSEAEARLRLYGSVTGPDLDGAGQ